MALSATIIFDPAKVRKLIEGAPEGFSQVQDELLAFADFLEQRALTD
jgi:hypothetical protein